MHHECLIQNWPWSKEGWGERALIQDGKIILKLIEITIKIFEKQQGSYKEDFKKGCIWLLDSFISLHSLFISDKKCVIWFMVCVRKDIVGAWGCLTWGRKAHITKYHALKGSLLEKAKSRTYRIIILMYNKKPFQSNKKWLKHLGKLLLCEILRFLYFQAL